MLSLFTICESSLLRFEIARKSEIKIAFNSAGKSGRQNKVVTIVSNASNDENTISFVANILDKKPQ